MQVIQISKKLHLKAFFERSESRVYEDKGSIFSKDAAEIALIFLIYAAMFCLLAFLTLEFVGLIFWLLRETVFFPFYLEISGILPELNGENLKLSR